MKKLYFIVPIVGTLIFFFFYSAVKSDIKIHEEKAKQQAIKEQAERAAEDVAKRKRAFEGVFADAQRQIARAQEREAEINRKAEETQSAKDTRDLAYRERERQYKRLVELQDQRTVAEEQRSRIQEQLKLQQIQSEYLAKNSKEVVQAKISYEQALSKMEAAEKAAAAAEAAAKAAAAAKRS